MDRHACATQGVCAAPGNRVRHRTSAGWAHVDVVLVGAVVAIAAFGVLMIYTATRVQLGVLGVSPTYYAKKQLVFLVVGPAVDLKLIALQAGTFGRGFAARFAPLTFVVAVLCGVGAGPVVGLG